MSTCASASTCPHTLDAYLPRMPKSITTAAASFLIGNCCVVKVGTILFKQIIDPGVLMLLHSHLF